MSLASYQLLRSAIFIFYFLHLVPDLRVQRYTFIWNYTNFLLTFYIKTIKLLIARLYRALGNERKHIQ